MKVCHISSVHSRYDQRILYRECVSLQESGYDVSFLVNDSREDECIKGIKIKSTKKQYTSRLRRMLFGVYNVYRLAKKEDAEIYHFHDPELMLIAKKLKKKGKKVIFDSHEIYYLQIKEKQYLPALLRNLIAFLYLMYERHIIKRIDGVIFPVKMADVDFESYARHVGYVNNLPRLDEIPEIDEQMCEKRGVCYTGSLTYERGISKLALASHIATVPLYLAGRFEPEAFKDTVLGDNEDGMIEYMGCLNRDDVYKLYQRCSIGASTLLPIGQYAIMENLPTKVYEYMLMGLPVLLSDIPYNRKMIDKYDFGMIVDPENEKDIACKIKYLVENEEEAKRMGENGKKLVKELLNWSQAEAELLGIYRLIQE